jgi:hypothetical protein
MNHIELKRWFDERLAETLKLNVLEHQVLALEF